MKYFKWICLLALIAFFWFEAKFHFDKNLVDKKKEIFSAQKDWSLYFDQSNVFRNGGLKHDSEFAELSNLLEPNSSMITDLATSYYAAAGLPVYVKNVHRHHGRYKTREWEKLIAHRIICYLDAPEYQDQFLEVIDKEETTAKTENLPPVRYIAINRTHYNDNFKRGCMSQRRRGLLSVINELGTLVYDGQTISVYRLSTASADN